MNRPAKRGSRSPGIQSHLIDAMEALASVINEEAFFEDCSIEVQCALEAALESVQAALKCLELPPQMAPTSIAQPESPPLVKDGPTRQQGQFLAYIQEFMRHSYAGIAPTHAELQRFFNVTPPSVNSMLKKLEERGFVTRIPGKARAIEITISPDLIPPLERPFKK